MSETPAAEWTSWHALDEKTRRRAVQDREFWSRLSEAQRKRFLDEADWQEILQIEEAKLAKLDSLLSLDEICTHLDLTDVQIYWLMSTRKLPGFLVGGEWKFDSNQVDSWVEQLGGKAAARADVEQQIAKHRAAANGDGE